MPAAEAIRFPAIQLFVERATAATGDFVLTDADAPFRRGHLQAFGRHQRWPSSSRPPGWDRLESRGCQSCRPIRRGSSNRNDAALSSATARCRPPSIGAMASSRQPKRSCSAVAACSTEVSICRQRGPSSPTTLYRPRRSAMPSASLWRSPSVRRHHEEKRSNTVRSTARASTARPSCVRRPSRTCSKGARDVFSRFLREGGAGLEGRSQ